MQLPSKRLSTYTDRIFMFVPLGIIDAYVWSVVVAGFVACDDDGAVKWSNE